MSLARPRQGGDATIASGTLLRSVALPRYPELRAVDTSILASSMNVNPCRTVLKIAPAA